MPLFAFPNEVSLGCCLCKMGEGVARGRRMRDTANSRFIAMFADTDTNPFFQKGLGERENPFLKRVLASLASPASLYFPYSDGVVSVTDLNAR